MNTQTGNFRLSSISSVSWLNNLIAWINRPDLHHSKYSPLAHTHRDDIDRVRHKSPLLKPADGQILEGRSRWSIITTNLFILVRDHIPCFDRISLELRRDIKPSIRNGIKRSDTNVVRVSQICGEITEETGAWVTVNEGCSGTDQVLTGVCIWLACVGVEPFVEFDVGVFWVGGLYRYRCAGLCGNWTSGLPWWVVDFFSWIDGVNLIDTPHYGITFVTVCSKIVVRNPRDGDIEIDQEDFWTFPKIPKVYCCLGKIKSVRLSPRSIPVVLRGKR